MIMCTLCKNHLLNDVIIFIQCGHLYHIDCWNRYSSQNYTKQCMNCNKQIDSINIRFQLDQLDQLDINRFQQLNQMKFTPRLVLEKKEQKIEELIKHYKYLQLDYYIIISDLQQLIIYKNGQRQSENENTQNKVKSKFDDQDFFLSFQYDQTLYNEKEQVQYQSFLDQNSQIYLNLIDYQLINQKYFFNSEKQNQFAIYFKDICSIKNQDPNYYEQNLKCFQIKVMPIQSKIQKLQEQLELSQKIIKQQSRKDKLCTLCSDEKDTEIAIRMNCGHIYHKNCFEMLIQQSNSCLNCQNGFNTCMVQFSIEDGQQIQILQNKELYRWTLKNLEIRKAKLLVEIQKHIKMDKDYAFVIENLSQYNKKNKQINEDGREKYQYIWGNSQNIKDLGNEIKDNSNYSTETYSLNNQIIYLNKLVNQEAADLQPVKFDFVIYFTDICCYSNHNQSKINQNLQNLIMKKQELQIRQELLEEQLEMTESKLIERYRWRQQQSDRRKMMRRRPPQTNTQDLNERLKQFLGFPNNFRQNMMENIQQDSQNNNLSDNSSSDSYF